TSWCPTVSNERRGDVDYPPWTLSIGNRHSNPLRNIPTVAPLAWDGAREKNRGGQLASSRRRMAKGGPALFSGELSEGTISEEGSPWHPRALTDREGHASLAPS